MFGRQNAHELVHVADFTLLLASLQALLHLGASPSVQDGLAHTPLHWAARQGYEGISHALVTAKASIYAENRDRITPLHLAAQSNSGSIVQLLLSQKADPAALTLDQRSVLHFAAEAGSAAVTDRGETPLARAAARGHGAVVQLLLQAGSQMQHANCFGQARDLSKPPITSAPTSRLRSTAKDARSSVANIVEVSQMLTPDHDGQFPAFKSQGAELAHRLPIDEFSAAPRASVSVAAFHEDEASLHKSKSVILDSPPSLELEEEELAVVEEDTPRGPSWLSKYVIFPGWTSKLIWDLAVMTIVLMDAFVLPVQLSFKRDYGEDAFDDAWFWVTTLCFSADILVTFDTGLTVAGDDQDIITDHGIIARAYLRGWFSLDFLSTMPWSRMVDAAVGSDEGGGALLHAMYLVRVLLVIVAICHWNACIFWMVGRPDSIITDFMPTETRETFEKLPHWTTILHTYGKYQVASMGNAAYDVVEEEWTYAQKPFSDSRPYRTSDPKGDVYIFCFYWTLGVMRTMPSEVQPVNLAERT
eukprot:g31930.t1